MQVFRLIDSSVVGFRCHIATVIRNPFGLPDNGLRLVVISSPSGLLITPAWMLFASQTTPSRSPLATNLNTKLP